MQKIRKNKYLKMWITCKTIKNLFKTNVRKYKSLKLLNCG